MFFQSITYNRTSGICILLCFMLLFMKVDKVFYILCFTAILTTVAVFDLNENSILLFHLVFLILLIKYIVLIIHKEKMLLYTARIFVPFLIWCMASIPFSLFYSDIVVMNIDSIYKYVRFDHQQITQFLYLLIGILTCYICNSLLSVGKIKPKKMIDIMDMSYITALCLALLQLVLPVSVCRELFRNSVHAGYHSKVRISEPFGEPSFWALVCTPFFCGYLYRFVRGFQIKYLFFCMLFVIVLFNNRSSSAFLGGWVGILSILFLGFYAKKRKTNGKRILLSFIILFFLMLFLRLYQDKIINLFLNTLSKLKGEGISGSERSYSFRYHLNIFLSHPTIFLFGIGYGTVRSLDLFSTWACEVGIVGLVLYLIPMIYLCWKLLKLKTETANQLLVMIIVYNIILFVATCEIYFLQIWMIYGIAFFMISKNKRPYVRRIDNSYDSKQKRSWTR